MSSAYGVDATKGAANTSNPYDFKNVQVSWFILLCLIDLFMRSKNHHPAPIKIEVPLVPEPTWQPPWDKAQASKDLELRWNRTHLLVSRVNLQLMPGKRLKASLLRRRRKSPRKRISSNSRRKSTDFSKIALEPRSTGNWLRLWPKPKKLLQRRKRYVN